MSLHYTDPWLTVYAGDCREVLATLPAESVHCVVTSPPYWGLRDYGQDSQLGLEPTPEQYVANLVVVFREVRRVLRKDGTLWLNLGDSYASSGLSGTQSETANLSRHGGNGHNPKMAEQMFGRAPTPPGLKPKDLVGIPWRVAFALQADGWYLRSDVIWSKPNPMPESVTDRPTKSHEYLFLLSKSARYYYDADAVREPHVRTWDEGNGGNLARRGEWREESGNPISGGDSKTYPLPNPAGRNLRSVWTIPTTPYPGAHFAVFPQKLVEPCILAGTSARGVCPECGAPWERQTQREGGPPPGDHRKREGFGGDMKQAHATGTVDGSALSNVYREYGYATITTTGWQPSCRHVTLKPQPATVLDPFAGSGTVGLVAQAHSRRAVLIDLNPDYLKQQLARNAQTPLGLGA